MLLRELLIAGGCPLGERESEALSVTLPLLGQSHFAYRLTNDRLRLIRRIHGLI